MRRPGEARILKSGPARSLLLDATTTPATVIKRFHHPRPWSAVLDRRRAQREFELLRRLHERGVGVPCPLSFGRGERGWEVRMRCIEGATSLADLLRRREPPPGGWQALLSALGGLLAEMQGAGVEHPDLHPGNALVDPHGRPFLLDFHAARERASDARALLGALIACAAAGRESLGAALRARFLVAWYRATPAPRRAGLPPLGELGRQVERAARGERRASVLRNLDRWSRASSRCDELADGTLVRRGAGAGAAGAAGAARESARHQRVQGSAAEVGARWRNAARLWEHGLPVLAPLALSKGRGAHGEPACAVFERSASPPERGPVAPVALGALLGALHDRGLDLAPLAAGDVELGPDGAAVLLPPSALASFDPLDEGDEHASPGRRFRALERLVPPGARDAAFRAAYLAAFEGWPAEARELRERWTALARE